jgi:hypothetical protein
MTTLKVTFKKYEELMSKGITLDMMYLLKLLKEEVDVKSLCENNVKLNLIYSTILRKQLITSEGKPTKEGEDILTFFDSPSREKLVRLTVDSSDFERWWKAYPGTDSFEHKNVKFKGSRALRVNKEECLLKFNKIVAEGDYTADNLIKALEYDVAQKRNASVSSKTNKITYMQNSLTYLNQRTFEPFIELMKENDVVDSVEQNGIDI